MASRYDSFVELADRLIRQNGRAVTLQVNTSETASTPSKPWLGVTSTLATTTTFAVFDQESAFEQLIRLASGRETPVRSNTERARLRAIIPAKGLALDPSLKHKVIDGADTYEVTDIQAIRPGDTPIAYFLILGH